MDNKSYLDNLNAQFSIDNEDSQLKIKNGKGDIPLIDIRNKLASAIISLQGAHILSWKPHHNDEVIWLSEDATFALGKSVRGGIPICWPWFGAHTNNSSFPAHGFARTVMWQVIDTNILATGETQVTLRLKTNELANDIQQMWPMATIAEYRITVAKTLKLELTSFNQSDKAITVGQALHTYFAVDDISNTTVFGLEGKTYLDKTDNFNSKIQSGPVTIGTEVDRVYLDSADDIVIDDKKRK